MPDEDSEAEKMSPLLEVGISYEENGSSRIEISVTDPKVKTSNKCTSDHSTHNSIDESPVKEEDVSLETPITGQFRLDYHNSYRSHFH